VFSEKISYEIMTYLGISLIVFNTGISEINPSTFGGFLYVRI
jgi:hypothetical protein